MLNRLLRRAFGVGTEPDRDESDPPAGAPAPEPPPAARPGDAFTPTRPQRSARRFVGRRAEFDRIRQALEEDRAHVIIYGERGRGKTSLANLVVEAMRASGHMVARHTCGTGSDFDSIMRGLARDLPRQFLAVPAGVANAGEGAEAALPGGILSPRDVASLPARLAGQHLVLVLDEFDCVADAQARIRLAEAMKQASDRGSPLSVVLVGVAASPEELLGGQPLVRRNLVRVPLPLLSDEEIEEIVGAGAEDCGIGFPPAARMVIVRIARGVPHVAHLLGLRVAQAVVARGAAQVARADLLAAVERLITETDAATTRQYEALTARGQDAEAVMLLQRIAAAPQDRFGRFAVQPAPGAAAEDGRILVGGVEVAAAAWQRLVAASAFRPSGDGVAFANPELQTYLLLQAASRLATSRRIGSASGTLR